MGHAGRAWLQVRLARCVASSDRTTSADDAHGHERDTPAERRAQPEAHDGANAQPRLPPTPWALYAWPRRRGATLALRIAKSAGWKTPLPMPITATTEIEPAERRREPGDARAAGEQRDAREQDGTRAEAIDGETRRRTG